MVFNGVMHCHSNNTELDCFPCLSTALSLKANESNGPEALHSALSPVNLNCFHEDSNGLKILISVDTSLFRNGRRLTCKWLQGVQPVVKL